MDLTTEAQRQSAWDRWGGDINAELLRIDAWFAAYSYAIPDQHAVTLRNMLVDLSARISECPGLPGKETFAPRRLREGEVVCAPENGLYLPLRNMDDALAELEREEEATDEANRVAGMRRFDAALAERARMRRDAVMPLDAMLAVAVVAIVAGLLVWWSFIP